MYRSDQDSVFRMSVSMFNLSTRLLPTRSIVYLYINSWLQEIRLKAEFWINFQQNIGVSGSVQKILLSLLRQIDKGYETQISGEKWVILSVFLCFITCFISKILCWVFPLALSSLTLVTHELCPFLSEKLKDHSWICTILKWFGFKGTLKTT